MTRRIFSYEGEKGYYAQGWPKHATPYEHLEPYLRCWLDPESVFGMKRVLDIGAGGCVYTRLIAERFHPKQTVACDLFRERFMSARRENINRNLQFVTGDCFRLPFQDGSFEVVFGSLILQQLPGLQSVVLEIRRVLSERGCYVGIEPNPWNPRHLIRYLRGRCSPNQYLMGPRHLAAFQKAGFDLTLRYFYVKWPWLRSRFTGSCMGILARRQDG